MMPGMKDALPVAASGYSQEDERRRALAAGFDEHLARLADIARLAALPAAHSRPAAETV